MNIQITDCTLATNKLVEKLGCSKEQVRSNSTGIVIADVTKPMAEQIEPPLRELATQYNFCWHYTT